MSAEAVGGARSTVEKDAESCAGWSLIGKRRGDIARRPKANKPIGSMKKGEGSKKMKKPWLIGVQHPGPDLI